MTDIQPQQHQQQQHIIQQPQIHHQQITPQYTLTLDGQALKSNHFHYKIDEAATTYTIQEVQQQPDDSDTLMIDSQTSHGALVQSVDEFLKLNKKTITTTGSGTAALKKDQQTNTINIKVSIELLRRVFNNRKFNRFYIL